MKLNQHYQSKRYSENAVSWRNKVYFPLRANWLANSLPIKIQGKILDAGCGDGAILANLKKLCSSIEMYGVDIPEKGCRIAAERDITTKLADLNYEIPFKDDFFDFIIAHEVIEHLIDPDKFLEECNRVLKKEGYLIITTPNLTAWYHRIFFLFGLPPLFLELSTRNRKLGIGVLKHIIKNKQPVGHIRVFTPAALNDLVRLYGFKVEKIKGAPIAFGFPKIISLLYDFLDSVFSFFPSLSSNFMLVAKKQS